MRCQGAFDAGFTPAADPPADTLMKRTADGFKIACAGCQKEFESTGPRCCSDACERRYRERQANIALMAEAGIEPTKKRRCAAPGCSSTIPKWRKGRAVSKSARFCSPACQKRAKRAMEQRQSLLSNPYKLGTSCTFRRTNPAGRINPPSGGFSADPPATRRRASR